MWLLLTVIIATSDGIPYHSAIPQDSLEQCKKLGDIIKNGYAGNPSVKFDYVCVPTIKR